MTSEPARAGEYRGTRLRRGTRMLRMRSAKRFPQQGQPERPLTHPGIPHEPRQEHACAECFGPRSRYRKGQFCFRCEQALFGDGTGGYERFIASERQRRAEAAKRRARRAAREPWPEYVPGPPRGPRPRGACPECGRDVPLCNDGTVQSHRPAAGHDDHARPGGNCAGSRCPAAAPEPAEAGTA
jgi:hypothetical protein